MTSLMIRNVLLFLCWVIMSRAEDLPISFTDYMAVVNGNFDNYDETKVGNQDRIDIKGRPVLIPGLVKEPVLYVQELMNGKIYRTMVFVRNESSTDKRLNFNYYNITDPSKYTPETFSTDDLSNLTRDDFHIDEGCMQSFVQVSPGVLFGGSTDCRHVVNGHHPVYTIYLTCRMFRFEPPMAADEETSLEPYELSQRGQRYPLIGAPEGYVNPCQDDR